MCATYEIACMERMGTHGANGNVWLQISFGSRSSWARGRLTALLGGNKHAGSTYIQPRGEDAAYIYQEGFLERSVLGILEFSDSFSWEY